MAHYLSQPAFRFRNNLAATTDPGVTDDTDSNYVIGSWWINTSTPALFVCLDNTAGAAVWRQVATIFVSESPTGALKIQQNAANPLVVLDQNATAAGSSYIDFQGTEAADVTGPLSTLVVSGATTHHIQIEINGVKAWIAASTNDPTV